MAEKRPQTLANHARLDPLFHFFLLPVFLINLLVGLYRLNHRPDLWRGWIVVVAFALMILAFKVRLYSLKVQDRVIRLEERLRLATLLPETLRTRILDLTEGQLVALRFASDGEVLALVERALRENLKPAESKKAIQMWRPDYWRV